MIHNLKIQSQHFKEVLKGTKTFEVRFNDRNYQVKDVLVLREYDNQYTGSCAYLEVTYILNDKAYCKDGYVIMSIEPLAKEDIEKVLEINKWKK